jgi:site-specific recombinase XerD
MELVNAWGAYQQVAGLAPATITTRTRTLARLHRDLGPLECITRADLMVWLAQYEHAGTRASFLSYIRCFYAWANDEELLSIDPTRRIPRIKTPRRQPRPVPRDVLQAALGAAGPRERLWIELMAWAGLRVAEVAACRPEHAYQDAAGAWWIIIPRAKGGSAQTNALPSWLGVELHDAQPWDVGPQTVTARLGLVLRSVGSRAKPHAFRHYYGTMLLTTSGNLRIAQQGLRHADISTTQVYTAVSNDELSRAVERLPRIA